MTVSSTSTFELDREKIILRAFNLAGVYDGGHALSGDDQAMASDILGLELDDWQNDGLILKTVSRETLALVASTSTYTLASTVMDVVVGANNMVGTVAASGGGESLVRALARHDYQTGILTKDTEGTPSHVFIERFVPLKLIFWPVPSEALTFSHQQVRLRYDMKGGNTLDLEKRAAKAIVYCLAWQLALSKGHPQRAGQIKKYAEEFKARARAADTEGGSIQMYVRGGY